MTLNHPLRWTDPSSLRCGATSTPQGVEVTLPNRAQLFIDTDYFPVDWNPQFASDNASTRLWHRSLTYLPAISELPGGWQTVESILRDFSALVLDSENAARVPSMDHALAIQIRVCHDLLERGKLGDSAGSEPSKVVERLLPALLILAREPGIRVANNHGVMLSVSLMLIAAFHPNLVSDAEAASDARVALEQMQSIFDEDGLSNENTASYQGLYVRLLRDMCDLMDASNRHSEVAENFRRTYELTSTAYQRLLLPDGQVPPLGDGGMGKEIRFPASPGKLVSPHNGLYVNSNSYSYISITCGARSPVHKQMDDTSLLMWAHGRPLILDAGVQNYDAANLEAAKIRTQPGHSGLYFREFDDRPLKFFNTGGVDGGRRVQAAMTVTHDGEVDRITGEYTLEGNRVVREVTTSSPASATITDRVWSQDGSSAVARFLLEYT